MVGGALGAAPHPVDQRRPRAQGRRPARCRVGRRVGAADGRRGGARRDRDVSARRRRGSCVWRRRRADGSLLRAFRRAARRGGRRMGDRSVRARGAGRLALRARGGRRQGPALGAAQGDGGAGCRRRAARERPLRVRRGGGDRRPAGRRLHRLGRARSRCGGDLRLGDAPARRAGLPCRDARDDLFPRPRPDRRARPALGHVRRCGAELDRGADADASRCPPGRERHSARAAASGCRPSFR